MCRTGRCMRNAVGYTHRIDDYMVHMYTELEGTHRGGGYSTCRLGGYMQGRRVQYMQGRRVHKGQPGTCWTGDSCARQESIFRC
jgi:hypothetical protein